MVTMQLHLGFDVVYRQGGPFICFAASFYAELRQSRRQILMGRNARMDEPALQCCRGRRRACCSRYAATARGYGAYRGNNGHFATHVAGVNEEQ